MNYCMLSWSLMFHISWAEPSENFNFFLLYFIRLVGLWKGLWMLNHLLVILYNDFIAHLIICWLAYCNGLAAFDLVVNLCRYGLSKRYYCSKTNSTNTIKTSPIPEQAGTNWRSFLIVWYHVFHLFQDAQYLSHVQPLYETSFIFVFFASLLIPFISDLLLQPGLGLAGIGGLFFLVHYNDERRAVLKGNLCLLPESSALKCICMSVYIYSN